MFKKGFTFYMGMCAAAAALTGCVYGIIRYWEVIRGIVITRVDWIANTFIHREDGEED